MEINVTVLIQMIIFLFYIIFCVKYIWPYINKVIEKRQKKIYLENKKIKKIKKKFLFFKNEIKKKILNSKKLSSKIILEAKNNSILLIEKYKIKAKKEYKKILYEASKENIIQKKIMYEKFFKNISDIINLILINITSNTFDKKIDNKYISKVLNKFKIKKN